MPEVIVNVEVYCAECGGGLCSQTQAGRTEPRDQAMFRVGLCRKCVTHLKSKSYKDGYAAATSPNK